MGRIADIVPRAVRLAAHVLADLLRGERLVAVHRRLRQRLGARGERRVAVELVVVAGARIAADEASGRLARALRLLLRLVAGLADRVLGARAGAMHLAADVLADLLQRDRLVRLVLRPGGRRDGGEGGGGGENS